MTAFSPDMGPLVKAFWTYMQSQYGTRVRYKKNSRVMRGIGKVLDRLRISSYEDFMEGFVTTLGKTLYLPSNLQIGVESDDWDLWEQITLCVHEHQHVEQYQKEGVRFMGRYLFKKSKRALYEADAFRSDMELYFWRFGAIPSVRQRAKALKQYGCGPDEIRVVEKYLALSAETTIRGGVINRSTRRALEWLNEHMPELKAAG